MKPSAASDRRVGLFILGMGLHLVGALMPLHELGHVLAVWASGARVTSVSWNLVTATHVTAFTLAMGTGIELVVWGAIAIFSTRNWSRLGFFASGAATSAWMIWWLSKDRAAMEFHMGASPVAFWDLVFVVTGLCLMLTRRHQLWLKNPKTMRMVTGQQSRIIRRPLQTANRRSTLRVGETSR